MEEQDGYVVQSRWGLKLHKAGCPCGVCKSRRKATAEGCQPDTGSKHPTPTHNSVEPVPQDAPLDNTASPALVADKQGLRHGARTAPAAVHNATDRTVITTAVKSAMKGRLCMELMALGTPEVPLNRARVPRQAATAAKAAIKKDLLEQNRRVGAAQVSTSAQKANAEELKPDAAAPLPTTAAKQTAAKPKRPAKRRRAEEDMAAESPAGPEAEPSDSPQQAAAAAQETSPRSKLRTASAKSESSHRSRHSTDVQKAPTSPNLSQAHAHKANSPEHTSKMKANGRASKRQKVKQNGATEAATADLDADACAGILSDATERPKGAFRKRTRASFQHGLKEVAAKLEAPDKLASDTATQAAEEVKPQPTPASQAVSEATQSASKGQMEARVTTTADSAQAADGPAHPDESAKPAQQEHTAAEQFAKEVRNKAGWGPAVDLNVRSLMASGQLAGQPVHIKLKHREPVHLQGKVQANGMVRSALHVGGPVNHECSLSEFEKLGASKERRPGENVHLTNFGLALKDFAALVNEIGETARSRCMVCNKGVGIIKCKGCSIAAHPQCVELTSRQQQANWFCKECKASGQDKLPQRAPDLPARARAPPRPPARPHSAPASAPSHAPPHPHIPSSMGKDTSCVSPAGRVHMAVPVSGMTPARRERNGNKHKRLFLGGEGALTNGEPVVYKTSQHGILLAGEVRISPGSDANTGILCQCCNLVISCSKFEAHAGQGSRRAPYDNIFTADGITLRARAAQLPPLTEEEGQLLAMPRRRASGSRNRASFGPLSGIADGCRDVIHDLDHDAGGCCVCGRPDFALGEFCDRTMILCDQCEREFHVGCLRRDGRCDLTQLPTGDWFCSNLCNTIWDSLNATVAAGLIPLEAPAYPPGYTIQMLRGRAGPDSPGAEETNTAIDIAQNVLQESFDPIIDKATKENLLLLMTKAEVKGEYDYRGMYTALLSHEGRPVCAAVMRAFGAQLAEVPLVATKADARRQGHCRVLMQAFEVILKKAGVRLMCLPAAHETVQTWIQGFGLSRMPLDDLDMACKELRLLIFPGTQVLQKQLLPPLPPTAAPQIHLAPQTEGLAPSQDAQPESALQASSPASISHAGMPEISSNTQLSAAPEPDAGKAGVAETALRPQSSALVAQHITQDAQLTTYTQPDAQMVVHANSVAAPAPSPEHQSNAATWVLGNPPEGQQAELLPSESAAPVEDHGPNHMASEQVTHDEAEQPNAALPVLGTCQKMQQPEAPFTDLAAPAQQQTPRVLDAGQASVMEAEQASPAAAQSLPPMEVDQTSAGDTEQAAGLASAAHSDTVATVHASPDSDGQPFVSNVVRDSTQEPLEPVTMLHPGGEETEAGPQPQLPASAETTGAQTVTSSIHLSPPPDAASNPSAPAQTDQLECKADSPQNLQAQQATGRFPQTDSPQQANMDWCNESQLPQELHMLGQLPRSSAVTMQLADDSCEAMQWQATDAVALQQPQPAQQHLEANARQLTPAGPHQKQQPVLAGLLTGSHRADPDPEPFHQSAHDHPLDDGNSATAGQLPTAAEATQQVTQDSSAQLATGY